MDSDVYLPPESAAARVGLSTAYLAKLRVKGGGPPYKVIGGRRVVYPADLLEQWKKSREGPLQQSTADGPARRRRAAVPAA